jgi:hypothetical protein
MDPDATIDTNEPGKYIQWKIIKEPTTSSWALKRSG